MVYILELVQYSGACGDGAVENWGDFVQMSSLHNSPNCRGCEIREAENTALQAEIERLKGGPTMGALVDDLQAACQERADEIVLLKADVEKLTYAGGHFQCPKCKFYLVRNFISPDLCKIRPDRSTPENCPNDGTEMMAVTWRELLDSNTARCLGEIELANKLQADLTKAKEVMGKMSEALMFSKGAIQDAIGCDDGLDGGAGEAVLDMIEEAMSTHKEAFPL